MSLNREPLYRQVVGTTDCHGRRATLDGGQVGPRVPQPCGAAEAAVQADVAGHADAFAVRARGDVHVALSNVRRDDCRVYRPLRRGPSPRFRVAARLFVDPERVVLVLEHPNNHTIGGAIRDAIADDEIELQRADGRGGRKGGVLTGQHAYGGTRLLRPSVGERLRIGIGPGSNELHGRAHVHVLVRARGSLGYRVHRPTTGADVIDRWVGCEARLTRAVGVHHVDFGVPVTVTLERDLLSIRGPAGADVGSRASCKGY